MADNNDHQQSLVTGRFGVLLFAMGSASFMITMYHLLVLCCQNAAEEARRRHRNVEQVTTTVDFGPSQTPSTGEGVSLSHLIPAHKYVKKKKEKNCVGDCDGDDDDGTCAVCLGEFEEGEEARALPLCMHSFHVACIDMWLHSHSTCPLCRGDATPSPAVPQHSPEIGSGEVNAHHSIDMMQIALVQNGLVRR